MQKVVYKCLQNLFVINLFLAVFQITTIKQAYSLKFEIMYFLSSQVQQIIIAVEIVFLKFKQNRASYPKGYIWFCGLLRLPGDQHRHSRFGNDPRQIGSPLFRTSLYLSDFMLSGIAHIEVVFAQSFPHFIQVL